MVPASRVAVLPRTACVFYCPAPRVSTPRSRRLAHPIRSRSMRLPAPPCAARPRASFHRSTSALRAPLAALVLLLTFGAVAHAETPRVHAIVGARIVTAPGQVIEHGTIVIRDGVIVAVGASVAVPADARVWKGDSLTVYPGLIDALVMPAEAPGATDARPGRRPIAGPAPGPARRAAHELPSV